MHVLDVLTSPWAITPEMLRTICDIYDRHLRGEPADLEAIEAATGKRLDSKPQGYTVQDGVAVVPVEGVITKRANLFTRISGGVSTQLLQSNLQAALDDPNVQAILLAIDSPGGSVDGTQAVAQFIREVAKQKPMAALIDGQGASGGYWIASAVGKGNVFITGDTTAVGSIGVVAAHVDRSEAERQMGIKVTEITSGAYKRVASEHSPLTPEGFASIKQVTDHIYTVFVDEVAANRGTDSATVLQNMADGRIFLGQKAITAGLVDGMATMPAVMQRLMERVNQKKRTGAIAPRKGAKTMFETVMICGSSCTEQESVDAAVKAAIAKAEQDAKAKAETDATAKLAEAKTAGATAERERILAVEANLMPGHEKLVAEMKADGKTTGPEAAQRILAAEKAKVAQIAGDLKKDAPPAAPASEATGEGAEKEKAVDAQKIAAAAQDFVASEAKAGRTVSYSQAVQHVMKQAQ